MKNTLARKCSKPTKKVGSSFAGRAVVDPSAPVAVDLFCGVGGLTNGLKRAGVRVVAGVDLDPTCRFAFEFNNRATFIHADVAALQPEDLRNLFPQHSPRVLVACAPCQSFSRYARRYRPDCSTKWALLREYLRLILSITPDVVSMENVPELKREAVFGVFVANLISAGYSVWYQDVYCPDYGVPQHRKRLVLLASLHGPIELPPATHIAECQQTVRMAIAGLHKLAAGEVDKQDRLHRAAALTSLNLERIRHSKPGGCWREWPNRLIAKCHQSDSGHTYPAVYGRMLWDMPSPTITTQFFGYGNGRFGHPSQDRALSLREGAILQSFPRDYTFVPPDAELSFAALGRLIGNAVPVRLGEIIGIAILKHLQSKHHE